ncbi:hypothetical protein [Luteococcus japonicus]|uniref:Uncharacterized protein n=1 Tax=Luteococcus japonicus LSP_Lj1 TaxID=1255658 RepID=A0A1R4KFW2_9ACTN|nr:hypothetical protein [Luteococcus japonicus]SJN43201.1 hypothetical protein FM114_14075 [Luteococcus japonicus LSP_Lj1]
MSQNQTPVQKQQATAMAPIMMGLLLGGTSGAVDAQPWQRIMQVAAILLCVVGVYLLSKTMKKQ